MVRHVVCTVSLPAARREILIHTRNQSQRLNELPLLQTMTKYTVKHTIYIKYGPKVNQQASDEDGKRNDEENEPTSAELKNSLRSPTSFSRACLEPVLRDLSYSHKSTGRSCRL